MRPRGFTLIELLVVIAIIGLLGTLSVVSFSSSREKARMAKAVGHEGQVMRYLGDDAVARWDFDECSATTIIDYSGRNNNGLFVAGIGSSSSTPMKAGCSMYSDGTSQVTISGVQTGIFQTKALWVNMTGSAVTGAYLLDEGANNNWIQILNNRVRIGTNASGNYFDSSGTVASNKWHFIVVTYDGTTMTLYLDGKFDRAVAVAQQAPSTTVTLGNYGGGGAFRLNGYLDNVRLFNRALSSREVHQLYAQEVTTQLVKY